MPRLKDILRKLHVNFLRYRGSGKSSINPQGKVLIMAPHPDDEVIGCGGLIARLVAECNSPHIIIMTGGEGAHNQCCSVNSFELVASRRRLTDAALRILSVDRDHIHELDFPDGGISADNPEMQKLKKLIDEIDPDTIFVPHRGEGWPDHVNTAKLINDILNTSSSTLAKPQVWEYCVWMWYYNVWRGLDWKNAYKLKMSPREHQLKSEAMDAYIRPLAPCGKPWSGVLPQLFVKANSGYTELYFKVR